MADAPLTPPAPTPPPVSFWQQNRAVLTHAAVAFLSILLTAVATWLGLSPKVVEVIKEVPVLVQGERGEYAPTMGWHEDPAVIAENVDPAKTTQFAATPAGRAVMATDADVYLWRAVRKAGHFKGNDYPNIDQGAVGDCVGAGNKHSVDVLQAVQIANGHPADWKPVSLEVIYAGSRVEIGGGQISGDGSTGAWANKWLQTFGVVPMEKLGRYDLSAYSESRARSWGRTGVPKDLETAAKQHPVKGGALVKSFIDVEKAIRQGYPVPVCSNVGYTMERDKDGFCRPQGRWDHCMAIIGVRGGKRPGAFILNSWGDKAHTGPVYPPDAPVAGFWADAAAVDRMVRQGDSFALSDISGFPSRELPKDDWFILNHAAPRPRGTDVFALEFRLAP